MRRPCGNWDARRPVSTTRWLPLRADEFVPAHWPRIDAAVSPARRVARYPPPTATTTSGQVLVVDGGFAIVDFEGDAEKPLATVDGRERQSPLDDVAGMLRSFSRAADSALAAWTRRHPESADHLQSGQDAWEAAVHGLFLPSYRDSGRPARGSPTVTGATPCCGRALPRATAGRHLSRLLPPPRSTSRTPSSLESS